MKKAAHHESKSLKTFYVYLGVVLLLICASLVIKMLYIFQESKFDPAHNFTLAIVDGKQVREIVAFHPETPSMSLLRIKDSAIPYDNLAKSYGIATDGYILTPGVAQDADVTNFLYKALLHMSTWQSNLTILDKIRLFLVSKNVATNNKTSEEISLVNQTPDTNTTIATALSDQDLSSENVSIQIVNATNVSGLGQRLGKVLTNMGANVVDVTFDQKIQKKSTIAYYGNESYTVNRMQKFLNITATVLKKQAIADIIITIGNDKKETKEF